MTTAAQTDTTSWPVEFSSGPGWSGADRVIVPDVVRRRLLPPMPSDRLGSWLAAGAVGLIAAVLHVVGLTHPKGKIFDEIYYATEGHDLITHGVEWNATSNTGDFVVHPPLGKWIIGGGEAIFGYHELGWRIAAAVFGTLAVILVVRIGRRIFRSTMLGCAAGLLMTLDGMEFVLSRSALLDIFLMTFILAAFGCLVLDREWTRRRWLRALEAGLDPSQPGRAGQPAFAVPYWRLAAAALTGCAMAVKWSALWYWLIFLVLIYLWEVGARRSAGAPRPWSGAIIGQIGWLGIFCTIVTAVYIASWSGWFLSSNGYDRHWLRDHQQHELPIIGPLYNLWQYHLAALHFHDTLTTKHPYQSWPWQWLLLGRPVAFYYSSAAGCGAASCSAEVLLLGTPILWWSFLPALLGMAWLGVSRRDWRVLALGVGVLAGIVPWFPYELSERTMFYFYALPAEPFLILAVVYVFGAIMRAPRRMQPPEPGQHAPISPIDRRQIGALVFGVYLLAVAVCFAYFYPIYVGQSIPYSQWLSHMWLGSRWI